MDVFCPKSQLVSAGGMRAHWLQAPSLDLMLSCPSLCLLYTRLLCKGLLDTKGVRGDTPVLCSLNGKASEMGSGGGGANLQAPSADPPHFWLRKSRTGKKPFSAVSQEHAKESKCSPGWPGQSWLGRSPAFDSTPSNSL